MKYLELKDIIKKDNLGCKYLEVFTGDVYKLVLDKYGMLELRILDSVINEKGLKVEEIWYIEQLLNLEFVEVN